MTPRVATLAVCLTAGAAAIVFGLGGFRPHAETAAARKTTEALAKRMSAVRANDPSPWLNNSGLRFAPDPTGQPAVTMDEAIQDSQSMAGAPLDSNGQLPAGVDVSATYGLFSDDDYGTQPDNGPFQPKYENVPAWRVTYTSTYMGFPEMDASPPAGSYRDSSKSVPQKITSQDNYLINAETGAFMEEFN